MYTSAAREWLTANEKRLVSWRELSDARPRMVSAPKGIYKPAGDRYALTVRVMRDSPYHDGEIFEDEDGWFMAYHQEGSDPSKRDTFYTNRALAHCMRDNVPVGVLLEEPSVRREVRYRVLGLAYVERWLDGYYFLRSARTSQDAPSDVVASVVEAEARRQIDKDDATVLADDYDARVRAERSIVMRQGAATFRASLLAWFRGRCAFTGCDAVAVLDAAHISPYRGPESNSVANGVLLRTDLHTLFDRLLLGIDPYSGTIQLSARTQGQSYGWLDGQRAHGWGSTLGIRQEAMLQRAWQRFLDEESARMSCGR